MNQNPIISIEPEKPDVSIEIKVSNEGEPGYTPQRGIDYWTDADKREIVDGVKQEIGELPGGGTVKSVNGKSPDKNGNVVVDPELPSAWDIPSADPSDPMPYDKVLGTEFGSDGEPKWVLQNPPSAEAVRYTAQTLNVNQQAQARKNIGAQPAGDYALKSEIPSVAVQSVNGKTGDVVLTADDVGAAKKEDVERLSEEIGDYDGTAYVDVTIEPNVVLNNTTGLPGPTSADTRAGIRNAISLKTGSVIDLSSDKYAFGYNLFVDSVLALKSDWTTGSATIDRDCDVVIHFKKADNSSFTEEDVAELSDNFTIIAHGISLSENFKHLEQKTRQIAADAENVFELNEALNKNKWSYGDIVASAPNGFVLFPVNIPAGEYAFSGVITTTDTDDERFSVHFLDADNAYVAQISIIKSNNGSRFAATVTLTREVAAMRLYAGYGASGSKNDTATFTQLQLETGAVATDYVAYGNSAASFVSGAYTAMRQSSIAVGLFNLFRLPLYHHLNQETDNVGIPAQSLYDIHYAKSLGFDLIEVNEHECSDGVFVCKHGLKNAIGNGIKALDNEDYSATLFSAVTSEWLRENIRYASTIGKYCGFIPTLDEFCRECRKLNMSIKISNHKALPIVRKYLPDNMIWLTGDNRKDFTGTIEYVWENTDDIDECIETCKTIGAPLNIVIKAGQFDSTSDEMVAELCAKAHENGFTVGTVYPTANALQRAHELGVDVSGATGNDVNLLVYGNAKNITDLDSAELALNNAVYNADNDTITVAENGTITIAENDFRKGIASIRLRYSGTLTIKDGVTNLGLTEYASTEEKEVQMSIVLQPYDNRVYTKWLVITANTETTIYDIDVHCSYI